jgi:hypothetical protein
VDDWYQLSAKVRDGKLALSVNGREIGVEKLPEPHEPWLGFHAPADADCRLRNIKIGGEPAAPEEISLSSRATLNGWFPFSGEDLADKQADWVKTGEEIQSRPRKPDTVDRQECLLQYVRPLIYDSELTYEFFYKPGEAAVHPALDRLAFLVRPEGISTHWVTDGVWDRTMLSPGNVSEEKENRRGPEKLPLKENDWNALKLTIAGDTVSIAVNGVPALERKLPAGNRRLFGLFHYADEGQARVRNIVWRGAWPREIPAQFVAKAKAVDTARAARKD